MSLNNGWYWQRRAGGVTHHIVRVDGGVGRDTYGNSYNIEHEQQVGTEYNFVAELGHVPVKGKAGASVSAPSEGTCPVWWEGSTPFHAHMCRHDAMDGHETHECSCEAIYG